MSNLLTDMKASFLLLLSVLLLGTRATEYDKRQEHHTHTPHPHHTPRPADPMAAWMEAVARSKPNVLFIIVDDLRPMLGSYGETHMVTPNIDYLASKSLRFTQAFAQVAVGTPSRASILTGRRPETTRVFDLRGNFRDTGNFTTLPQYFKENGYYTRGVGRIFDQSTTGNSDDHPYSWSVPTFFGHQPIKSQERQEQAVRPVDVNETGRLIDMDVAEFAVDFLDHYSKTHDQPFFLAVGFHKPHLPFLFPEEYLSLYPSETIQLAANRTRPPSVPRLAWSPNNEIRRYDNIRAMHTTSHDHVLPDDEQIKLRQGYYAAISYTDAQVGRVLEALSHNNLVHNTLVVFMGDNGYHLGDNAEWAKHTNYDVALRIPLLLYIPGVTSRGLKFSFLDALSPTFDPTSVPHHFSGNHSTKELVEAVDLYPTLAELAGLSVPPTCDDDSIHEETCTEGTSLVPLVKKARHLPQSQRFSWKDAAFSSLHRALNTSSPVVGLSIRTKDYRYTEWLSYNEDANQADFSQVEARELYDLDTDPTEFDNVADDPDFNDSVSSLSQRLHAGWRQTLQNYLESRH